MQINSIIISTVDREPEYIHQTLATLLFSLKEKREVYLVVDGLSYKSFNCYKDYCRIILNKVEDVCDNNLKRAAVNYARCLSLSKQLGGFNLILEDDIVLHPQWVDIIKNIEINGDKWVLSLNCMQNSTTNKGYEEFKTPAAEPDKQQVWCRTYAVIYSPKLLESLSEDLLRIFFGFKVVSYDVCLGGYFLHNKISIYETVPGLVNHMGEKTLMQKGNL